MQMGLMMRWMNMEMIGRITSKVYNRYVLFGVIFMKYEMDMSVGSLWKKIFIFSCPLMFSNVLQIIFNLSDVAVVGKFSGAIALGAVGSTTILISLFTGIFLGLGGGVNVLTALHIGSKNKKGIQETVHTSAIFCFLVGLIVMVVGIGLSDAVLEMLNTKPQLIESASQYLKIYLLSMPALAMYNCGNSILSAAGDTKRPLYYLMFAGIINVALNLFFVIVFHLSVVGVGMASVIAQYVSASLVLRALFKSEEAYGLKFGCFKIHKDKLIRLIQLGIPAALQYALFAIANLFVQVSVNSFSHVVVEGNSAAANADSLIYDMMAAFYTACASFIAQNRGAGNKKRILESYLISLAYSFGIGLVLGLCLFVLKTGFLTLFTNDLNVMKTGYDRIKIMAFSYCISAFMDCTTAASRGLGKSIFPTAAVITGSVFFRILWIYTIFAHFHTIQSLYLLYVFSWAITAIVEIIYFVYSYRKLIV